jgi:glutaconate CoA-transferase, subunit A
MTDGSGLDRLNELLEAITDGCLLGVPADYSGVPMAATRTLVQRGVRDLRLYCLPLSTLQADLLIGAGCVASVEAAAITLGEFGIAPRFTAAVTSGEIEIRDSTCPALHAALQATEKGVPFMPLRGLLGSDILRFRPDWMVIDNPFGPQEAGTADPIVLLPAVSPDVALFHASMADQDGNVWIGRRRELATMAHAAKRTLVTVERIHEGSFYEDERLTPGVLPALYVDRIAVAERGAWPLGLPDEYEADGGHLREYARLARTAEGFHAYLDAHVFRRSRAA